MCFSTITCGIRHNEVLSVGRLFSGLLFWARIKTQEINNSSISSPHACIPFRGEAKRPVLTHKRLCHSFTIRLLYPPSLLQAHLFRLRLSSAPLMSSLSPVWWLRVYGFSQAFVFFHFYPNKIWLKSLWKLFQYDIIHNWGNLAWRQSLQAERVLRYDCTQTVGDWLDAVWLNRTDLIRSFSH
jgi:hypothetical protein